MKFEWDPQKADSNRKKHGVSFQEAASVLGDVLSITYPIPIIWLRNTGLSQ